MIVGMLPKLSRDLVNRILHTDSLEVCMVADY